MRTGSWGSDSSLCEPWTEQIKAAYQSGLSIERIYQDLVCEHGFSGSYDSVWRFVKRFAPEAGVLPFRRMECAPGEELQVDFGQGAWILQEDRKRKTHLFRCVLSCSRKAYSEAVWKQDTESFIRAIENAFRHFGGVTATVVIDNLKAGVIQAQWYDPESQRLTKTCTCAKNRDWFPRGVGAPGNSGVRRNRSRGQDTPAPRGELLRWLSEWLGRPAKFTELQWMACAFVLGPISELTPPLKGNL